MRILRETIGLKKPEFFLVSLLFFLIVIFNYLIYSFGSEIATFSFQLGFLFLGLSFIYEKTFKDTLKKLGFFSGWKNIIVYTLLGLGIMFFSLLLLSILINYFGVTDHENVVEIVQKFSVWMVFAAVILAPLSEEIFFRGFLTSRFGIIISSVIFSLAHFAYGSFAELIATFAIGMVLAWIYKKSKSLIPCILIHFIYNFFSLLMLGWMN